MGREGGKRVNISNLNELFMGVYFAAISDKVCRIDQDQWFVGNSFSFVFRIDSLKIENQKNKKVFFQVFQVFSSFPGFFTWFFYPKPGFRNCQVFWPSQVSKAQKYRCGARAV